MKRNIYVDLLILEKLRRERKFEEERPFLQLEIEDNYYNSYKKSEEVKKEKIGVQIINI
tara:strand:+ start:930 stop:1106 length:177 start_codon:yes stop_codon:yes gene_type:complete